MSSPAAPPPVPKQGLPALAWVGIGCGGLLLLAIGVIVVIALTVARGLETFMANAPVELEQVEVNPAERDALLARFDGFLLALDSGAETEPLRLTGRDLNILVQNHPKWEELRGIIAFRIVEDQIGGTISFPLEQAIPSMAGKYLNGEATFRINLSHGDLDIFLQDLEVNGQSPPEPFLQELRREDLYDANSTPGAEPILQKLQSITVEGGEIIFDPLATPKRPVPGEAAAEPVAP